MGFPGLDFAEFALIQTQIVEREDVKDRTYKYTCYDVQRQTRKEIFDRSETILTDDIAEDETGLITVLKTDKFETYYHGSSYSSNPDSVVGHIEVTDGKAREIITYTGKTGSTFTGLSRGAFGTQSREWVAAEDGKSRKIKVIEHIYLELPTVKLAYAVLTGTLYGDGYTLPAHWHLGIDPQYIATSKFTTIGLDWWDTSDDTKGRSVRFEGLQKTDGKRFIERELYGLLGCFSPVLTTGELGLKRIASIVSNASYTHVIDKTNIVSASDATYEHDQVINFVKIKWGYKYDEERYSRANYFYDPESKTRHKLSSLLELEFQGLHSAKHSIDAVRSMFDGFRDRFAGPPIAITVTVMPSLNPIEVGDVVRLNLPDYPDYFGPADLDRSFEVEQTRVNWYTGAVTLKLVGSTQKASPLVEYGGDETIPGGTAVPDSKYTDTGADIESAFSGSVSRSGSIVTVGSDFTLSGANSLNDSGSVYYVDGDFTLPFGREITIEKNVFLKVKGFFNCFGTINGRGLGHPGEDYRRYQNTIVYDFDDPPGPRAYIWDQRIDDSYESGNDDAYEFWVTTVREAAEGLLVINEGVPIFVRQGANRYYRSQNLSLPLIDVDPETLEGLPNGLWGQGGPAGDSLWNNSIYTSIDNTWRFDPIGDGGNGGNGGAGLAILSRGMSFGTSGKIDISANNGEEGDRWDNSGALPYSIKASDGGGGTPGNLYIFIDGANNSPPTVDAGTVVADDGSAPDLTGAWNWDIFTNDYSYDYMTFGSNQGVRFLQTPSGDLNRAGSDFPLSRGSSNDWQAHSRVQHLIAPTEPQEEPQEETEQPLAIDLTEYTNTPITPEGNRSTIDITVTPPTATNYSYSIIQARKQGDSGWFEVGPAQHEVSYTAASDGSTWEFRALAVSTTGVVLDSGPVESITLGDFSANYATIRPPVTVTGLRLTSQAAGSVFTTPDLQFTWNLNNLTGTGYTEPWFSHFKVEIRKADNSLLYTETTKTNIYTLTYSENAALSGGPYSSLQVRVYQVTVDGEEGTPANVTFTNAAPALPSGFSVTNGAYGSRIKWTNPGDVDFQRAEVYLSETSGFTPGVSNRVYAGTGESVDLSNLSPATTYYYVARSRDTFGNYSSYIAESSFTTSAEAIDWDNVGDSGGNKPDDNADVSTDTLGGDNVIFIERLKVPENNGEYSTELSGLNTSVVYGSGSNGDLARAQIGDTWANGDKAFVKYVEPTYNLAAFDFEKESYFKAAVVVGNSSSGDSAAFVGIGEWNSGAGGNAGQGFIGVEFDGAYAYAVCSDGSGNKTRTEILNGAFGYEDVVVSVHNKGDGTADVGLQVPYLSHDSTTALADYVPTSGYGFSNSKNYLMLGVQAYALDSTDSGNGVSIECGYWRFIQKA